MKMSRRFDGKPTDNFNWTFRYLTTILVISSDKYFWSKLFLTNTIDLWASIFLLQIYSSIEKKLSIEKWKMIAGIYLFNGIVTFHLPHSHIYSLVLY
jgi:hypothetical protein